MPNSKIFAVCSLIFIGILSGICEGSDRMLKSMTLEEKVGQLFVIRPDQLNPSRTLENIHDPKASGDKKLTASMIEILKEYPAGGFAIFRKNIEKPAQLKQFTAELKNACNIAPIMAIDEEGGKISRIANYGGFNVPKYASMEAIGKTGKPRNAYNAARTIGRYLKEYGFTLDFAPVADINPNPDNIVIGSRAFGSDAGLVSGMVSSYLDGLHSQGIAGSIKHFPGHGDTSNDTHSGYVAVYKTWDELKRAELIPFMDNFGKADTVMIAHITMKNVTSDDLPATLSKELITGKLRGELGYNGVIITDAMNMGAIHDNYSSGEAALLALEAGNDILLMPYDYIEAFNAVLEAVRNGRISESRLNQSVQRILALKNL